MTDSDVRAVRSLLQRYSEGDDEAIRELVAPSFFTYEPADDEPSATDVFIEFAGRFRAAASDLRVDIPDLAPGDDGLLHGTAVVEGTWTGELWGAPPSGRQYRLELPSTVRRADGRYAFRVDLDTPGVLGILRTLGLVNPPDQMHLPPPHDIVVPDFIIKVLFNGQVADKPCAHLQDVRVTRTDAVTCDDCAPDQIWPALRMCLTCGHVGCCDTSLEKHAKAHWEQTGHPLMRSIRLDEAWIWCYEDNAAFQRRALDRIEARLGLA